MSKKNDLIQSKLYMEIDHSRKTQKTNLPYNNWFKNNIIDEHKPSAFLLNASYPSIKDIDIKKSNICILLIRKTRPTTAQQYC